MGWGRKKKENTTVPSWFNTDKSTDKLLDLKLNFQIHNYKYIVSVERTMLKRKMGVSVVLYMHIKTLYTCTEIPTQKNFHKPEGRDPQHLLSQQKDGNRKIPEFEHGLRISSPAIEASDMLEGGAMSSISSCIVHVDKMRCMNSLVKGCWHSVIGWARVLPLSLEEASGELQESRVWLCPVTLAWMTTPSKVLARPLHDPSLVLRMLHFQ